MTDEQPTRLLVKFPSHRQRDRAHLHLGEGRPEFFSLRRDSGCGVWQVSEEDVAVLTAAGVKFTRFRDGDDLRRCWGQS